SLRPQGWQPPPARDPLAGDYRAADGWVRLHTNAPTHRQAALRVLGVSAAREEVAAAVARHPAEELEAAVHAAGGCAAALRTPQEWSRHEQGRAVAAEPLVAWPDGAPGGALTLSGPPGRPLAGLRVLDLTRVLAGPVATRYLALLGAEVLRVDPPDWDEPAIPPRRHGRQALHPPGPALRRGPGPLPAPARRRRSPRPRAATRRPPRPGLPHSGTGPTAARAPRGEPVRLRAHRPLGGQPRLRQPGADEHRHRRGGHAAPRARPAHAAARPGARPRHRLAPRRGRGRRRRRTAPHRPHPPRPPLPGPHRPGARAGRPPPDRRPRPRGRGRPRPRPRAHRLGTGPPAAPPAHRPRRRRRRRPARPPPGAGP